MNCVSKPRSGWSPCQMTVDLFDYGREQYIPEVQEWVGAECFLPRTHKAGVNLLLVGLVMQMP